MLKLQVMAWCPYNQWHDGEYAGPKHPCPARDCETPGGQMGHTMQKRRMWVCSECSWAYMEKPENHRCGEDWNAI